MGDNITFCQVLSYRQQERFTLVENLVSQRSLAEYLEIQKFQIVINLGFRSYGLVIVINNKASISNMSLFLSQSILNIV